LRRLHLTGWWEHIDEAIRIINRCPEIVDFGWSSHVSPEVGRSSGDDYEYPEENFTAKGPFPPKTRILRCITHLPACAIARHSPVRHAEVHERAIESLLEIYPDFLMDLHSLKYVIEAPEHMGELLSDDLILGELESICPMLQGICIAFESSDTKVSLDFLKVSVQHSIVLVPSV
jgi:hypothetical protein